MEDHGNFSLEAVLFNFRVNQSLPEQFDRGGDIFRSRFSVAESASRNGSSEGSEIHLPGGPSLNF